MKATYSLNPEVRVGGDDVCMGRRVRVGRWEVAFEEYDEVEWNHVHTCEFCGNVEESTRRADYRSKSVHTAR